MEAEIIEITKMIGETYVPYWQITLVMDKIPNLKLGKIEIKQEVEHENQRKKRVIRGIENKEE